jgi:nucleoside-diphosphate-sugar epimerase
MDMQFPAGLPGHTAKYHASKILAHDATKKFIQTQKPHYSILTLHPTFIMGRSLIQTTPEGLDAVNGLFVMSLGMEQPLLPPYMVHIDDVAHATLAAATAKIPEEETEFLLSVPKTSWENVVKYVKEKHSAWPVKLQGPFPEYVGVDGSRAEKILGVRYHSVEEIIDSVLDQQEELRGMK